MSGHPLCRLQITGCPKQAKTSEFSLHTVFLNLILYEAGVVKNEHYTKVNPLIKQENMLYMLFYSTLLQRASTNSQLGPLKPQTIGQVYLDTFIK